MVIIPKYLNQAAMFHNFHIILTLIKMEFIAWIRVDMLWKESEIKPHKICILNGLFNVNSIAEHQLINDIWL